MGVGVLLLFLYLAFLWLTLPSLDDPASLLAAQSTTITDRNGTELYRLYGSQDRTYVPGDQISDAVKAAIVATEDKRFYTRGCLDTRAFARLIVRFGQAGGASTLTRQLARNALNLQQENILNRKLKEIILGCQLEGTYSKDKILEMYLNWVPFGRNIYGVEQASRQYFGKAAKDLTLAESAVMASLPQLPSYYSPYGKHVHSIVTEALKKDIQEGRVTDSKDIDNDDVSIGLLGTTVGSGANALYVGGRSDQVLQNMIDQGMITEEERAEANKELRTMVFEQQREALRAGHFVLWVRDQVEKTFGDTADKGVLEQGGLKIETTLDWKLQQAAEDIITKQAPDIAKVYGANNIALVAMDPHTKEILAYVGNVDYADEEHEGKVDMALVPRQPGSSFKPFIYAAALSKGYSPATVLYDVRTKFGPYEPQNFEGGFWGLTTIRKALGGSRNIPAIKAYFLGGEEASLLDFVETLGAPTPKATRPGQGYGPSMAIGTAETPLVEMVQSYSTFADGGRYAPVSTIRKITDRRGSLLPFPGMFDPAATGEEVLDPRVAYQITSILSDPSVRPGDYWKNILTVPGTEAAAKTGTSNKCLERDDKENCKKRKPDNVWTVGYTPNLVVGVWVGNATAEPMSDKADGINVAAPLWKAFMTAALKIQKADTSVLPTTFTKPDGLVQVQASQLSGELPTECTPVEQRKSDLFFTERSPSKPDPACVTVLVDRVTGLLASDNCPVEAREMRSFFDPHSVLAERFPSWEKGVQDWARGSGAQLPLPLVPTEKCDITLTPGRLEKPEVTLTSPASGGAATYPSFRPRFQSKTGSGILKVEYAVDGKPVGAFTTAPFDGSIRVPRSIDKEGTHTLTITLTDVYYNTATDSISIRFEGDATGPDVSLSAPADGTTVTAGSDVTLRATATDPNGDIKYVEFFLDDILLTRKPVEPYELTYPLETTPGPHTLRALATDLAGNTGEDSVTVIVSTGE